MERLKATEYAGARDIARKTADVCLEAGDFKRARDWLQTARAVGGGKSNSNATQDEQFRRRYQEGLARLRPRQNDIAAAEARMAQSRALDRATDPGQGPGSTASKAASAAPPFTEGLINRRLEWRLAWIVGAGGLGLFVLGAAVLLRRNGMAVLRRVQRITSGPRHQRLLQRARRLR